MRLAFELLSPVGSKTLPIYAHELSLFHEWNALLESMGISSFDSSWKIPVNSFTTSLKVLFSEVPLSIVKEKSRSESYREFSFIDLPKEFGDLVTVFVHLLYLKYYQLRHF